MFWVTVCVVIYLLIILAWCLHIRLGSKNGLFTPGILSKKNMQNYYAIVTGSNTGIGYEVAKYLVRHGAHVVMACRNEAKGKAAAASINLDCKSSNVYSGGSAKFMKCDLSSLESTKEFVTSYKTNHDRLHILVNNAGMGGPRKFKPTKDGFHLTWQINYLAPFYLTHELTPMMIRSSVKDKSFDCRIVNTSSCWHKYGQIDVETLKSDEETRRKAFKVGRPDYGASKLAQIMHATYLQMEIFSFHNIAISACSIHPGGVRTNIFKTDKWPVFARWILFLLYPAWYFGLRNAEEGSRCTTYCAVAPIGYKSEWGGKFVPGAYHENMKPVATYDTTGQGANTEEMKKLYEYSIDALKVKKLLPEDYRNLKGQNCAITDEVEE